MPVTPGPDHPWWAERANMFRFLLRWLLLSVPVGILVGKFLKATQTPPDEERRRRIERSRPKPDL